MIVVPVFSNVHGQLDAQIVQLMQCKPLPEHEVCMCVCVCFFFLSFCLSVFLALFLSVHIMFFVALFFSSPFAGREGGEGRGGRRHLIFFSFSLFSLSYDPFSIFIFTDGIAVELHTAFTTVPSARFPQFSVCIHTSTVTDRVYIALVFSLLICAYLKDSTWQQLYQETNTGWLLCANVFHLSLS